MKVIYLYVIMLNLSFFGLYLWTSGECKYEVRLEVGPEVIKAFLDGEELGSLDRPGIRGGRMGLELFPPSKPVQWIAESNIEQGWDNVRVYDYETGDLLFEEKFNDEDSLADWVALSGNPAIDRGRLTGEGRTVMITRYDRWKHFIVEAELVRGIDAGIRVLLSNRENYVRLHLLPFKYDLTMLEHISNGRRVDFAGKSAGPAPLSRAIVFIHKLLTVYFLGAMLLFFTALTGIIVYWSLKKFPGFFSAVKTISERRFVRRSNLWLPLFAAASAVFAGIYINVSMLEGIPHVQDSVAYYFQSKIYASGRLWTEAPELPEFFEQQYMIEHEGRLFSQYPYGFPILLAVGRILGIPYVVNPALGGLSILLFAFLARKLFDGSTVNLSVLLMTVSPFFLMMSGTYMSHSAGMFYALAALYLTISNRKRLSLLKGLGAGFSLTLLAATRPLNALPTGMVMCVFLVHMIFRDRKIPYRRIAGLIAGLGLGGIVFLSFNYAMTNDPFRTTYSLSVGRDIIGSQVGFGPKVNLTGSINNLDVLFSSLMAALFPWPNILTTAPLLFGLLYPRKCAGYYSAAGGFLLTAAAYFFFVRASVCYGPRYYYEALPFIILLSVRGLKLPVKLAMRIGNGIYRHNGAEVGRLFEKFFTVLITIAIVVFALVNPLKYRDEFKELRGYNILNTKVIRNVEKQGIKDAVVFILPLKQNVKWVAYGSVFPQNDIFFSGDVIYVRSLGIEKDRLLMELYPDREYFTASYRTGEIKPYELPALEAHSVE